MTVRRHARPHPDIERTFTAVRAALPAANVAAFDAQLEAITHVPVVDLAALDEFLSGWWRIATWAAADPADWQRMRQEADQLQSGARSAGPTLAQVLTGHRVMRSFACQLSTCLMSKRPVTAGSLLSRLRASWGALAWQ